MSKRGRNDHREPAAPSEPAATPPAGGLRRIATGIGVLDQILGGGLPAYATVILGGEPGTGKTILSQQILFAAAEAGHKGLYLTTVSESPIKAARYQSEFAFFNPDVFGERVIYMDLGELLRRGQLGATVETIAEVLRKEQPDLVVIDSFRAIHDLATSGRELRTFTYDLAVELAAIQATTLLVGEYRPEDVSTSAEFAVADGIIWLAREQSRTGAQRSLRVLKLRGTSHPTRPFSFDISETGITIFALPKTLPPPAVPRPDAVVETGVLGLDELLRGGIPGGSPVLLSGEAGTGKTTLGMQYLTAGALEHGERGLYVGYEEHPAQLKATARGFGWDLEALEREGLVRFHYTPLSEVNVEAELLRIQQLLAATGAKRVLLDSLTMLMHTVSQPEVLRQYIFDLNRLLRSAGCTALLITDPPAGSGLISRFGVEESILDGVIVLRALREGRERRRYVEVYKLRGVSHATGEHLLRIGADGLRVFPRSEEVMR